MPVADNWLVIANPGSRNGRSRLPGGEDPGAAQCFGVRHDLVETRSPEYSLQIAAWSRGKGYIRLLALRGDGTAHYVASGVVAAGPPFGLIPAGSGNNFGCAIGLNDDPESAVETLVHGGTQSIYILKVTTSDGVHYSINMVDTGIGAQSRGLLRRSLGGLSDRAGAI